MKKNKVDIITLGCSKNLVDSEQLMKQLSANGYLVAHDSSSPDGEIVVINTCGFIGDAKEESINMILDFTEARKKRKIKKLFVMGCLSERYFNDLKQEIPEVDCFYGKFNWKNLIVDLGKTYHQNLSLERILTTPKHYAYLKISEGCSRTCSYCAIPIITGKHQSRSMEDIIKEVQWLVKQGVKEFQLIAQDLTFYGLDLYKKATLPELVKRISDIQGVEWIRLHYAYPAHFPRELLQIMRERDNVCKYLDIALQHISDPMLKLMRRNITKSQTVDLIRNIREEVPGIHLRTTMMVGHPGETEDNFQELLEFVQDTRFERLGAFSYSDEEQTYANLHYNDDIPFDVKQYRMDQLMTIQENIANQISEQKVGQQINVIIDKEEEDYYIGRTSFDSPDVDPEVLVRKDKSLIVGDIYPIKIISSQSFDLIGICE